MFNGSHSKRILSICLMIILLISCSAFTGEAKAADDLTGKTAKEITDMMGFGFNIGNSFDSTGGMIGNIGTLETSWGNPKVNKELIKGIKEAGFNTVRLPITWYRAFDMSKPEKFTISEKYFNRIKEVVDYCYEEDLFVIINMHHENWLNNANLAKNQVAIGEELVRIWEQIADFFADYDQHLIFEGMNEPRMAGTSKEWSPNDEGNAAVNYLDDLFVQTVRNSHKGHNDERCLMIPGYCASTSKSGLSAIEIPIVDGKQAENIIVSIHAYTPYNFCLSDVMKDFDPESSACVSDMNSICNNVNKLFLSKGIPVVMGETGATNKDNTEAREKWATAISTRFASYGIPLIIWDNGSKGNSGGECHAWLNRNDGSMYYPTIVKALMDGKDSVTWGEKATFNSGDGTFTPTDSQGNTIIFENAEGHRSTTLWEFTYIQTDFDPEWYGEGKDYELYYTGKGEPKLILDSEAKQVWWMQIDPDSIEEITEEEALEAVGFSSSKVKKATFTHETVKKVLESNKITKASDLRWFSILAADDNIATYKIIATKGTEPVKEEAVKEEEIKENVQPVIEKEPEKKSENESAKEPEKVSEKESEMLEQSTAETKDEEISNKKAIFFTSIIAVITVIFVGSVILVISSIKKRKK